MTSVHPNRRKRSALISSRPETNTAEKKTKEHPVSGGEHNRTRGEGRKQRSGAERSGSVTSPLSRKENGEAARRRPPRAEKIRCSRNGLGRARARAVGWNGDEDGDGVMERGGRGE